MLEHLTGPVKAAGSENLGSLLDDGLLKLGINPDDRVRFLLEKYIEEIELFNPAYGLVKVKDRGELIVKHILDSLAPVNIIRGLLEKTAQDKPPVWQAADVGSGAGFPGIPLAVCMNGAEFTLVERMARRAGFLRDVQALLGLANVRIEEADMERVNPGQFNLVVFRAFRPLEPPILKGLLRLLAPGGILAAYKGRRETIEKEMSAVLPLLSAGKSASFPAKSYEILPLEVPFLEEERHLVLIRL